MANPGGFQIRYRIPKVTRLRRHLKRTPEELEVVKAAAGALPVNDPRHRLSLEDRKARDKKIRALRASGIKAKDIAQRTGLSAGNIRVIIRRGGDVTDGKSSPVDAG